MDYEKDGMQSEHLHAAFAEGPLAEDRRAQWARYDAMMSSVRKACARHLEIICAEQSRADEQLMARSRAGAGQ